MNAPVYMDNRKTPLPNRVEAMSREIRADKIVEIKRQLDEGRYRVAERLDLVVDRIIEELLG